MAILLLRHHLSMGKGCNVWELGILERARSLAACGALSVFLIGRNVEGDEEEEVRADDTDTREGGELLAGAFAMVRHPWKVGRGEVGVRCEIDEP
jgi:hypothetical protein